MLNHPNLYLCFVINPQPDDSDKDHILYCKLQNNFAWNELLWYVKDTCLFIQGEVPDLPIFRSLEMSLGAAFAEIIIKRAFWFCCLWQWTKHSQHKYCGEEKSHSLHFLREVTYYSFKFRPLRLCLEKEWQETGDAFMHFVLSRTFQMPNYTTGN